MTLEDLDTCAKCGAQAEIHLYPSDRYKDGGAYIVDCINAECVRVHVKLPQYRTREEATQGWNEEQRAIRGA